MKVHIVLEAVDLGYSVIAVYADAQAAVNRVQEEQSSYAENLRLSLIKLGYNEEKIYAMIKRDQFVLETQEVL